jgi:serine/threonine protein kinase
MQLVDGPNLGRGLDGPLCARRLVEMVRALCSALAHAHDCGVLHRDIKPSNVLVAKDGTPCLVDFGLAKPMVGATWVGKTVAERQTQIMGTPAYMAPELLRGEDASAKSDVYALGALLYWLASGAQPFSEVDRVALLGQKMRADIVPLAVRRKDIPARLCGLVDACLAAHPDERPALADLASAAQVQRGRTRWLPATLISGTLGALLLFITAWPDAVEPTPQPPFAPVPPQPPFAPVPPQPPLAPVPPQPPLAPVPRPADVAPPETARPEPLQAGQAPVPTRKKKPKSVTQARAGTVRRMVIPWGEVFVDGQYLGNTPLLSALPLPGGRHGVEVRHPTLGTRAFVVVVDGDEQLVRVDFRGE